MLRVENQHPDMKGPSGQAGATVNVNNTESRLANIRMLLLTIGILALLPAIVMASFAVQEKAWQLGILSGLFLLISIHSAISLSVLLPRNAVNVCLGGLSIFLAIAVLATSATIANVGFQAAIVFLIYALIVSSVTSTARQANIVLSVDILVSASAAALTTLPYHQITVPLLDTVTPAILAILFMIYITMLSMQFVSATLRVRLVTAFLAIVIIPLAILSVFQTSSLVQELESKTFEGLQLAASQTALGVDTFVSQTGSKVSQAAQFKIFSDYLSLPADKRAGSEEELEMQLTMRVLDTAEVNNTIYLSSFALLDETGKNVYDTLKDRFLHRLSPKTLRSMGIDIESVTQPPSYEGDQDYYKIARLNGTPYISPIQIVNSTQGYFYASAPIRNNKGEVVGVLRARYDGQLLQNLLNSYSGLLGTYSYPILLDENNVRLADNFTPNYIYRAIAPMSTSRAKSLVNSKRLPVLPDNLLWTNNTEFESVLNHYEPANPFFNADLNLAGDNNSNNEIGAIVPTRRMPWKVVYLRTDYSIEAFSSGQRNLAVRVTTLIAGLVGLIAVGIAQLLSNPIIELTKTAQRIASGDMQAKAPAHASGEFGTLGVAFNLMTGEMHNLISSLEERVRARTQEIENQNQALSTRARQLQTVSDVARQIVSSQELESLLASITRLVSDRFDFYHVGIFLLDEDKQYAVLRAANSEGGQRMLARHHMLSVGKVGIVGYTTGTGQPRIATDVGEDAVYFNNPDLPDTRSEMALPLKVGAQIIGALDIQSKESNAFHPDDIELFNTLADQVAIAIYNNQLYMETLRSLTEAQNMHRQYLRQEWIEDTSHRKVLGYLFNQSGIRPQQAENPLWRKVFSTGDPVYAVLSGGSSAAEKAVMAVPISVRGETIGVIHVQDQGEERMWSEDEIAVVNSIASQVAVALENARLFENTVRRAEREKKVLQITQKIRSTNSPEEMMQIAISELQQALRVTRTQIYIREQDGAADDEANHGEPSNGHQPKS